MNRKGNATWTLKGYLGHDLSTAIDIFIVTMQVVIPFCLHWDTFLNYLILLIINWKGQTETENQGPRWFIIGLSWLCNI